MAMAAGLHELSKIATNPENSVADDDNLYEYDMSSNALQRPRVRQGH